MHTHPSFPASPVVAKSSADYPHPAWIEIDLEQLKSNIRIVRGSIGKSLYCLPVKANAYGHGLAMIARAAVEAGIDYLAVAHLAEGMHLREEGIELPILVLGAIHEEQIPDLLNYNLEFSISSIYKAQLVAKMCQGMQSRCRVHIEIDTGMQRTGVRPSSAESLIKELQSHPCFELVGIYSHLATGDLPCHPFAEQQLALFKELLEKPFIKKLSLICHMANSGGLCHYPPSHLDMVRSSLLTLGYASKSSSKELQEVKSCFSLKAKVAYFKVVEMGTGISYGHSHTTSKRTRIVTVPVGYGDGYRRCLSNRAEVLINGMRFPIVGTICMDQFMVDVGQEEVHVGDEVVLIGRQGEQKISIEEIAELCDTIPYEILCCFNERIPRIAKPYSYE